jgi:hypothetical protein
MSPSLFIVGFALFCSVANQPFGFPDDDFITDPEINTEGKTMEEIFDAAVVDENANPMKMVEILFFALFGVTDYDDVKISEHVHENTILLVKVIFSYTISKFTLLFQGIYGFYLIMTIIVLINLLIAMMSDTYCRIQEQVVLLSLSSCYSPLCSLTLSGSLAWPSSSATCRGLMWLPRPSTYSRPGWCS